VSEIIKVKNITTKFGQNVVHDNISFSVKEGEIFGILGGSGAGKTTLLREMIMLQKFQGGEIEIFGKNISKASNNEIQKIQERWGILFQFGALFSSLSVLENIELPLREYTTLPHFLIKSLAFSKLDMVGLPKNAANLYPSELSGGMKKRAGLARALALDPELLFLDEPTSGLDPSSARAFDDMIRELREILGFSVVVVTHDLDTIKSVLDRFILLHNKKIYFDGSYIEASNKEDSVISEFLNQRL